MTGQKSRKIRIGAGAGYSGDRIEPAVELAEKGQIQYLVFECLAERTIALAQQRKAADPESGYDPLLEERMRACLPACRKTRAKVITNMGAANPVAAMGKIAEIAGETGWKGVKIAAVTGDDVLEMIQNQDFTTLETGEPLENFRHKILSANAYLGAGPIVEALQNGADIIVTGRVADPALFLAPLVYEFGWSFDNYDLLGKGTLLGHLLECAGQVTGGYFADPGYKEVPDLARLGFPIAEAENNGSFIITKPPGSGGMVTTATCKEQLLYEIHDPAQYLTPDVIADFSRVRFEQAGKDVVRAAGASGKPKSGLLKVSVGYRAGYIGEGQISYGGPGAVRRGRLALDIVRQRFRDTGLTCDETRFDLIGVNALYGNTLDPGEPAEVRARIAARTPGLQDAIRVGNEVEALYTNGPAGGGGASKSVREVLAIQSVLLDSRLVVPQIHYQSI